MNIFGIGTDIIELARIELIWHKYGLRFAKHILSVSEIKELELAKQPACFLAKRFAAKEAVVKALGTGFRHPVCFSQIQIENNHFGKPEVFFLGETQIFVQSLGAIVSHISISDERHYALAFVVLEKLSP